jgi:hypothetical protein
VEDNSVSNIRPRRSQRIQQWRPKCDEEQGVGSKRGRGEEGEGRGEGMKRQKVESSEASRLKSKEQSPSKRPPHH